MSRETEWSCGCGATRARIDLRGSGRVVCYCKFCQAFARHTGAANQLDGAGGTDLIQTAPERLRFQSGADHLRCLRLSGRGPLRWYVACCGAPLGTTFARRSLPYLALIVAGVQDRDGLPSVQVRANIDGARGPVAIKRQRWIGLLLAFALRTARSWLTLGYRNTPFFDGSGGPVAAVERLTHEQKAAAFPPPANG